MRIAALTLFLCGATTALCQTALRPPAISATPCSASLFAPQFAPDFDHLQLWHPGKLDFSNLQPPRTQVFFNSSQFASSQPAPDPMIHRPTPGEQFDARMFVHPPQSSIGALPPGIPVARNLYPDLRFQLIAQTNIACLEPIPVQWPNLSFHPLPITWPKLKAVPAHNFAELVAVPPAK